MTAAIALYLCVGTALSVYAGASCREDYQDGPRWADALAFALVAVLWFPIAVQEFAAQRRKRR